MHDSLRYSIRSDRPEFTAWCAGVPQVGERPLTDEERAEFRRQAKRLGLGVLLLWLAFPIALFGFLAALALTGSGASQTPDTAFFVAAIGSVILIALQVTLAREWRRHSK